MARFGMQHARVLVAILIGSAVLSSSFLFARAGIEIFRIKQAEKRISVTGSASRRIKSDVIVWRATVKSQAPEMALAYKKLANDVPALVAFIKSHGIDEAQIKVGATTIDEIHPRDKEGRPM